MQYMMAMHTAIDFNAARAALSPINLRETCVLLMESAPKLAQRLQQEIRSQRLRQGPRAEEYLGLHLNIETIGQIIVELTKLGESVLHEPADSGINRIVLKELIECWLGLAEWILSDIEITDSKIH